MRRSFLLITAPLTAALACSSSTQLQVRGATFELSSKEIGLANQYDREDPHAADAQARCDYWTKRREDANGNHLVGLFSWPPEYFWHLRAWADAKKAEACDLAKAEADANAAKQNEEARRQALVEAEKEHEARDERAWRGARAEDCVAAAREDACDGVKAYLAIVPNGRHAADAAAEVQAAEPKIAELRRRREADDARRTNEESKQEEAAGFRVSSVRAVLQDVPAGGSMRGLFVHVFFEVTAIRAMSRGVVPVVKAACQVGDKRMVDVDAALDQRLDELSPGDTKEIELSPYLKRALQETPSRCEISVMKGAAPDARGPLVHSFCFVPGQGVSETVCAP